MPGPDPWGLTNPEIQPVLDGDPNSKFRSYFSNFVHSVFCLFVFLCIPLCKNSHNGTLKHIFFELNWGGRVNAISAIIGKKLSFRCRWALVTLNSAGIDLQGPRESARLPRPRSSDCAGRRFCARKCIKPTPPCAKNGSGNEKLFSQS